MEFRHTELTPKEVQMSSKEMLAMERIGIKGWIVFI